MRRYDLVIVGGGPAGGSCAYFASKLGLKVCVLEKRKWVGVPVCCAEGISKTGLENIFKPQPGWISSYVSGAHLFAPSGKRITIHHPDAGYILDRRTMERDILASAASSGAEIFTQTCAIEIVKKDKKFAGVIAANNKERIFIESEFIALACGVDTKILSNIGIKHSISPADLITSAQYLIAGGEFENRYPEFHIANRIAPGGYAWVFPKGENIANVGLGVSVSKLNGKKAVDYLEQFLKERFKGRFSVLERTGGIVPVSGPLKKLVHKNIILLGDAARLTDPFSGGGIANALLSGKLSAFAVYNALNGNGTLSDYEKEFFALKGHELEIHRLARKVLISLNDKEFDELGEIVDDLFGGKTFTSIDSVQFLKDIFLKHPKVLLLSRKLIPAFFK